MPRDDVITYEQWGVEFFLEAVNEERVLGAVGAVAGQRIEFGPVAPGPVGLARVRASGVIGAGTASRLPGEFVSYRVDLPVSLTFELDLQLEKQQFDAELVVPVTLTAVALSGVRVFIDATPPSSEEVRLELRAKGLGAAVLQRVTDVEGELRRFVARYVASELEKPHARQARTIEVAEAIRHAWSTITPRRSEGSSGRSAGHDSP